MTSTSNVMQYVRKNINTVNVTIFIIVLALSSIFPGISAYFPQAVNPYTRNAFNAINQYCQPGAVVLIMNKVAATAWGVCRFAEQDILTLIFSKPGVRIFMFSVDDVGRCAPYLMINNLLPKVLPAAAKLSASLGGSSAEKVYGVDYAVFPWYPGLLTAVSAALANIPSMLVYDYYGNSLASLPVMNGIKSGKDINLVYDVGQDMTTIPYMSSTYGLPIFYTHSVRAQPTALTYMNNKQLVGFVLDLSGAAEFETLMVQNGMGAGSSGLGIAAMGGQGVAIFYCIILIIIGNYLTLNNVLHKRAIRKYARWG